LNIDEEADLGSESRWTRDYLPTEGDMALLDETNYPYFPAKAPAAE
jgi:hypothetical protein